MKFQPKFFSNTEDGNHCLQASIMIVLNTLGHEISWEEVNKMTQYKDGLYSWTPRGVVALAEKIPGTKIISNFDYKEFASDGLSYLRECWRPEWFEKQKENASKGFKREQNFAKELIQRENLFEHRNIKKEEIENLLNGNLVIALVNSKKLRGESGEAGHFVVVYAENGDDFVLHDPGLPPVEAWGVSKSLFMQAFENELISIPKANFS